MGQPKRLGALNKFKSGERNVLVATDVASRGLDIPGVDVVINFDVPQNSKASRWLQGCMHTCHVAVVAASIELWLPLADFVVYGCGSPWQQACTAPQQQVALHAAGLPALYMQRALLVCWAHPGPLP